MPTLNSISKASPKKLLQKSIPFSLPLVELLRKAFIGCPLGPGKNKNCGIWSSQWISEAVKGDLLNATTRLSLQYSTPFRV
jgi:hypothetical protein